MKKISTAASHNMGRVEGQRLTVGLEVGDRSSWYCVLDEAGEVLLEQKVATTPKALKDIRVLTSSLMTKPRPTW